MHSDAKREQILASVAFFPFATAKGKNAILTGDADFNNAERAAHPGGTFAATLAVATGSTVAVGLMQ